MKLNFMKNDQMKGVCMNERTYRLILNIVAVVANLFIISLSCYLSINYSYWWLLLMLFATYKVETKEK